MPRRTPSDCKTFASGSQSSGRGTPMSIADVRAAGLRSNRPVTMLGHGHAGGGAKDGGGRGDVDRAEPVAAGADDIEDFARTGFGVNRRRDGFAQQFAGKRGDFSGRLDFLRE